MKTNFLETVKIEANCKPDFSLIESLAQYLNNCYMLNYDFNIQQAIDSYDEQRLSKRDKEAAIFRFFEISA